MSEETCTCCTCGYKWRRGQDGSHSCVEGLRKQLAAKDAEIERLKTALREMRISASAAISRLNIAVQEVTREEIKGT